MIVSSSDIALYVECPRFLLFKKEIEVISRPLVNDIFEKTIKKCLLHATQTGFRYDWRSVVSIVDKFIFQNVDMTNKDQLKSAKSLADKLLVSLHTWYYDFYMLNNKPAFINLIFKKTIGRTTIQETAPIVLAAERPTVILCDHKIKEHQDIKQNWAIRTLLYLVQSELQCKELHAINYTVGAYGALAYKELHITSNTVKKFEKQLYQVASCIGNNFDYSLSYERCLNCKFENRCTL